MKRFWEKVDVSGECWEWQAATRLGYGQFRIGKSSVQAHRVAWELVYGAVPVGLCVLHRCDNPGCVRPSHLFLGTHGDNMRDMFAKNRHNDRQGEGCGGSKLVENDVHEIRRLYATGRISQELLAKMWKVSQSQVGYIVREVCWRNILSGCKPRIRKGEHELL